MIKCERERIKEDPDSGQMTDTHGEKERENVRLQQREMESLYCILLFSCQCFTGVHSCMVLQVDDKDRVIN